MPLAKDFYIGNCVNQQFKNIDIRPQKISEPLQTFAKEKTLHNFFAGYIKTVQDKEYGLIIDLTSLLTQIHIPCTGWGHLDSNIDMSFKFRNDQRI